MSRISSADYKPHKRYVASLTVLLSTKRKLATNVYWLVLISIANKYLRIQKVLSEKHTKKCITRHSAVAVLLNTAFL